MQRVKTLLKNLLPKNIRQPILNVYHLLVAIAANVRYGFPARSAKVIMVTGTNGKTSVATLIAGMLEDAGYTVGVNTTAYYRIGGKTMAKKSSRTVEDMFVLHRMFARMRKAKSNYIVLEATSQALDQHRLWGVPCWAAVMTNLTQDHLDYHGTMERYAAAKFRLFARRPPIVVLNQDDEWFEYFNRSEATKYKLSYGIHKTADARITNTSFRKDGSDFTLKVRDTTIRVQTKLAGEFNVYNAAAAALVGYGEGLDPKQISKGIASVKGVPGRLQPVDAGQSFDVFIDYAHTPDALEKALAAMRHVTKGRLLLVFGATGDRDRSKRPIMGKIAAKHADRIFVTDEETYTEDGSKVRAAIMDGVKDGHGSKKATEIADRGEAIAAAFAEAKKGDTVLITGLGHELTRNMGGKTIAWDDTEVAAKLLRKISKKK